jgi:NitT/TauT family transport system substrate-binding protein
MFLFFRFGLLLTLVLGLSSCAPPESPVRVGANAWPGYEPMFLARSLGYYDQHPLQLMVFSSTAEIIRAYRNGLIDVAAVTLDEALLISQTQPDRHRIVLVCDASHGADVILAQPEFQSLDELRGRRVGVETTALGAYVLARALERIGLAPADVTTVEVPLLRHVTAFTTGQVDAVVTFEPYRSTLLDAGARKVFDSSEIPGEIVDVLVTPRELSDSQERTLTALVSGWFRALEYLRQHPADAAQRIAPRAKVTPQQFLDSLPGLILLDRQANLRMLGNSPENLNLTLQQLSEIMFRHKILSKAIEPPLLDVSINQRLKSSVATTTFDGVMSRCMIGG